MVTSRIWFMAAQKAELWERWRNGESAAAISRAPERKNKTGVGRILVLHGGIVPAHRRRALAALRLEDREEIFCGIASPRRAGSINARSSPWRVLCWLPRACSSQHLARATAVLWHFRGGARHHGLVFVAFVASVWAARARAPRPPLSLLFVALLGINALGGFLTLGSEFNTFSQSSNAARWIESNKLALPLSASATRRYRASRAIWGARSTTSTICIRAVATTTCHIIS